ncbi:MAG: hypothetical protein PHT31_07250, partial [Candidatus Omnitrophica bacterium]|nr:hypothetical protein [Candidatus Omnitrophota bacterium]
QKGFTLDEYYESASRGWAFWVGYDSVDDKTAKEDLKLLIEDGVLEKRGRNYKLTPAGCREIARLIHEERAASEKTELYRRGGSVAVRDQQPNWSRMNLEAIDAGINRRQLKEICRVVGHLQSAINPPPVCSQCDLEVFPGRIKSAGEEFGNVMPCLSVFKAIAKATKREAAEIAILFYATLKRDWRIFKDPNTARDAVNEFVNFLQTYPGVTVTCKYDWNFKVKKGKPSTQGAKKRGI